MKKRGIVLAFLAGMAMLFCGCSGSIAVPTEGETVAVNNNQRFFYRQIPATAVYSGSTMIGDEFELNLGEDPEKGIQWTVTAYTLPMCLVKVEHDREGFWPFLFDKAEVSILPKRPGISSVTLQGGEKTVTILVDAR